MLSDLYPNQKTISEVNKSDESRFKYISDSIDATDFSEIPKELKTMICCFQHLAVKDATSLLASV